MAYQSKIIKKYEAEGWTVVKVVKLSKDGYPDLLMFRSGKTMWIEVKEKNDTLKNIQKYRIDELNKNNIPAFCMQDGKGIIYGKEN